MISQEEISRPAPQAASAQGSSPQKAIRTAALYVLLIVLALIYITPIIGVLLTSLKTDAEIAASGAWALPHALRFGNYADTWAIGNIHIYLVNSFLVTVPATFLSIALGTLTGYVFSELELPRQ